MFNRQIKAEIAKLSHEIADLRSQIDSAQSRISEAQGFLSYMRNKGLAAALTGAGAASVLQPEASISYWTSHNVTQHHRFETVEDSLSFLRYRNEQYPGYIELMPQHGLDRKVVVDYGCGPGHDLIGFAVHSRPARLIGIDVSHTSLDEARSRLELHEATAELLQISGQDKPLPLEDASVDYVHCSGVLMLVPDPVKLLCEFRRILKPGGEFRIMIYNRNSLWFHLYVAYIVRIEHALYPDLSLEEAFGRTTDGEDCPLVRVWRPAEMIDLAAQADLGCKFLGAAPSLWEMNIAPRRFEALMGRRLNDESRNFLQRVAVDAQGRPWVDGAIAGIDGCFRGFA
jgi:SAM-dependent methyltransferase